MSLLHRPRQSSSDNASPLGRVAAAEHRTSGAGATAAAEVRPGEEIMTIAGVWPADEAETLMLFRRAGHHSAGRAQEGEYSHARLWHRTLENTLQPHKQGDFVPSPLSNIFNAECILKRH